LPGGNRSAILRRIKDAQNALPLLFKRIDASGRLLQVKKQFGEGFALGARGDVMVIMV